MEQNPQIQSWEQYPLADAVDHEILMHRDAHFGGLFSIMLDYYSQDGKGVQPEFTLEKIERLATLEKELNQNLAALFLSGPESEKVADAREAYKTLRSIYEVKNQKSKHPQLLADLILAEDEEAEAEVEAIAAEKGAIVAALIDLIRNEQFYDPLFPGYGQAPFLAVKALGAIGDKRAIIALFEAVGQGDFFADDLIIKALKQIGEPAKEFLLRVVAGRPINEDNERAAIALIAFREDENVAAACFNLLREPDVLKDPCLSTYLILACEGLRDPGLRKEFKELAQSKTLPSMLKNDMQAVLHGWG